MKRLLTGSHRRAGPGAGGDSTPPQSLAAFLTQEGPEHAGIVLRLLDLARNVDDCDLAAIESLLSGTDEARSAHGAPRCDRSGTG